MEGIEIERVGSDDWERFRAVRLRALADSPNAVLRKQLRADLLARMPRERLSIHRTRSEKGRQCLPTLKAVKLAPSSADEQACEDAGKEEQAGGGLGDEEDAATEG